jgi:hypothetical protein
VITVARILAADDLTPKEIASTFVARNASIPTQAKKGHGAKTTGLLRNESRLTVFIVAKN